MDAAAPDPAVGERRCHWSTRHPAYPAGDIGKRLAENRECSCLRLRLASATTADSRRIERDPMVTWFLRRIAAVDRAIKAASGEAVLLETLCLGHHYPKAAGFADEHGLTTAMHHRVLQAPWAWISLTGFPVSKLPADDRRGDR